MDMYLLIPLGFISVSFIILFARKKSMEEDLAFVKAKLPSGKKRSSAGSGV